MAPRDAWAQVEPGSWDAAERGIEPNEADRRHLVWPRAIGIRPAATGIGIWQDRPFDGSLPQTIIDRRLGSGLAASLGSVVRDIDVEPTTSASLD